MALNAINLPLFFSFKNKKTAFYAHGRGKIKE